MEWLVGIAIVVAAFWLGSGAIIRKAKRQQEDNSGRVLDEWFDGRDQVIVTRGPSTLSAESILAGANERGYKLISSERMGYPRQSNQQMVFEKNP